MFKMIAASCACTCIPLHVWGMQCLLHAR